MSQRGTSGVIRGPQPRPSVGTRSNLSEGAAALDALAKEREEREFRAVVVLDDSPCGKA
jgi:hypothetical protein